MKPGCILDLNNIKLYYPFFSGKSGGVRSLVEEGEWIVSYLLLCDVVLFPPKEFLLENTVRQNIKIASNQRLINYLFRTGRIITASTQKSIRDLKDLVEYYHPSEADSIKNTDVLIYDRDEEAQRLIYAEYLNHHIKKSQYYNENDKNELLSFLMDRPNHHSATNKIISLKNDMEKQCIDKLLSECMNAYFLAGAEGNSAIMPPSANTERSLIYNPFYSKQSMQYFKNRLEKELSKNILYCHPEIFEKIYSNLSAFREKYYNIAISFQNNYNDVIKIISLSKFQLEAPLLAIYAATATSIASIFSSIMSKEILMTFGAVFAAKFIWNSVSKILGITDKMSNLIGCLLTRIGVFSSCRTEVANLMCEFDMRIKKSITN